MPEWQFTATLIEWRGPAPFFFAPLPLEVAADMARLKKQASYGWGVIPVRALVVAVPEGELGTITFETSLFPRDGTYLLPLKDKVRRSLGVTVGDSIAVTMTIGGKIREPDL